MNAKELMGRGVFYKKVCSFFFLETIMSVTLNEKNVTCKLKKYRQIRIKELHFKILKNKMFECIICSDKLWIYFYDLKISAEVCKLKYIPQN